MTWLSRHLDEQALLRFHYHLLEPEAYQRLVSHLEECVSCRQELDRMEAILVQSPAPELAFGAVEPSNFWARMRRRRRLRRLRRGATTLVLLAVATLLLIWRHPEWNPRNLLRLVPAGRPAATAPPVDATQDFDLPLDSGWLQRYLPAAPAAAPAD